MEGEGSPGVLGWHKTARDRFEVAYGVGKGATAARSEAAAAQGRA